MVVVMMVPTAMIVRMSNQTTRRVRQKNPQTQETNNNSHRNSHNQKLNQLRSRGNGQKPQIRPVCGSFLWFRESLLLQPSNGLRSIRANQKNFLHRPGPHIQTLQPRWRLILKLKAQRPLPPPNLNPPRHNSRNKRTLRHDPVQNHIQPRHAPMLPFDSPELHDRAIRIHLKRI